MNKSILIIDDKKTNISMLSGILQPDYAIMAAVNGESAIRLLERKEPDLILLDVYMPGMDGFGVFQYIKSKPRLSAIPVIFVTGAQDEQIEEKGLSLGAVDYIKKPYNIASVRYKVRNQLVFKAYRDDLEQLAERRISQINASREAIIMGMALMSESHDPMGSGHIERIKRVTRMLTHRLLRDEPGLLKPDVAAQTILYAPLHDVGKIEIPDSILRKQGMLTADEYQAMQSHTLIGGDILRKTELFFSGKTDGSDLRIAVEIAENHHERYDGSGYPHGLRGEEIPLSARIVGLADMYDGLQNKRPYKRSFTHAETVSLILHGGENIKPSYFDPRLLSVFEKIQDELQCEIC